MHRSRSSVRFKSVARLVFTTRFSPSVRDAVRVSVVFASLLAGGACAPPGGASAGGDGGAAPADAPNGPVEGAGPTATEVLDTAIERMGGLEALRGIERVRYDMITYWNRLNYAGGPYDGAGSYERHTDVRDYTIDAWRNTREFPNGRQVIDLVRGDVAVRDFGTGFQPLNIAYVDERRELFAYTPDRLVLALSDAPDLRALSDTTLAGARHARVRGTVDRFEMTLHLRRGDALPSMVSFRAAHPNDFGLVPRGTMDIEVWYSGWQSLPGGVSLPRHWSVERIGQLYKRLTAEKITLNPEFAADSFAVADELADAYRQTATGPMHDIPLDSARVEDDFVIFGAPGSPAGAVRVGDGWLLLETGQARLSIERALAWMEENAPGRLVGAVVTTTLGNGGAAALAERGVPIFTGPGLEPHVRTVLRNHGVGSDGADAEGRGTGAATGETAAGETAAGRTAAGRTAAVETVTAGRWISADSDSAAGSAAPDSVYVEPIDLPDAPGSLLVYVPQLSWVYTYGARQPLDQAVLRDHARANGWSVEQMGNARGLRQAFGEGGGG